MHLFPRDIGARWKGACGLPIYFLFLCAPAPLVGQERSAPADSGPQRQMLRAVRATTAVKIDGDLSDLAWQGIPPADNFVQAEPYAGELATEKTEVRILYDKENLYIGVSCHDSQPAKIVVSSLKEDFPTGDTDTFEIILDTFQEGRDGFLFLTNPRGAKRDAQVTDEGRNVNADWDTVWDVRAQVNGDGWSAEMIIPFKSLNFDASRREQVWGVNFSRRIRRKNEIDFWSPVPRQYDIARVSLAGELTGLEGIERGRNLRIKPFVVGDLSRFARADHINAKLKEGVDAKYSLTPSLTLDLTLNTDFSQVEVDEQQINLTRFSLFFPEKREFFLENSGIFQFGDVPLEKGPNRSKETQLFFSRRLGLSAEGEPIPIWGGARLSGQVGKFSLGLLNMQTKSTPLLPGNNFAVLRVKRHVLANSDIGFIFLNRQASRGQDFHRTWGADGNFRVQQNWMINGYVAQTKADGISDRDRAEKISTQYRGNLFRFNAQYSNIPENFVPEMGFTYRRGVRSLRSRSDVRPRPPKNPIIREFSPHFIFSHFLDPTNRTISKENHYAFLEVFFHNGSHVEVHYDPYFDRLDRPFQIRPNIAIPAGDYHYGQWVLEMESDPSQMLSGTFDLTKGDFYSGKITTLIGSGMFRYHYHFTAESRYSRNSVELPQGSFVTNLFSTRLNYYFSTRMFLNALIQYNSDRRQVTSNIRFNFIHRPLSDLFLVYNEQREVSGARRADRAVTVKYTHLLPF